MHHWKPNHLYNVREDDLKSPNEHCEKNKKHSHKQASFYEPTHLYYRYYHVVRAIWRLQSLEKQDHSSIKKSKETDLEILLCYELNFQT
jgi:hypothetical protein